MTLKEKLRLIKLVSKQSKDKCDVIELVKLIESNSKISERGIQILMEKFASVLFFNDITLDKVFDNFDIDKD